MNALTRFINYFPIILLVILVLFICGLIIMLTLYFMKRSRKSTSDNSPSDLETVHSDSDNIEDYGINEILSSGKFTPAERAAEHRRRGKSPSGVINGIYNDEYRGNDEYNDIYRDWDADA